MAAKPRRRAVGPPGAPAPAPEPRVDEPENPPPVDDDERFRAERPPHHDRER
jgi:hypothetical protein